MSKMVKVWDLPTRLFHWLLVVLFLFMIISGDSDDLMEWHFYGGYLLSGLILFRLFWWVLGTRYARFSALQLNPAETLQYMKGLMQFRHTSSYGHTPPGSLMMVVLIGLIGLQLLTGMMSTDDIIWSGPLYNAVSGDTAELAGQTHEIVQELLQVLVGLHILAVVLYKVKFREALVPAMIHGNKPQQGNQPPRESVSPVRLVIAVLPAVGFTYWLFTLPI